MKVNIEIEVKTKQVHNKKKPPKKEKWFDEKIIVSINDDIILNRLC
jgi:hypothetical protein